MARILVEAGATELSACRAAIVIARGGSYADASAELVLEDGADKDSDRDEVFHPEMLISRDYGGGGNRTRALCPADSPLSSTNASSSSDDDPSPSLAPLRGKGLAYAEEDRGFESPCWIWRGSLNSRGYAVRTGGGRRFLVHRRAYEEAIEPIPPGCELHHLCRQRACVNPAHLAATTSLEHHRSHHPSSAADAILGALADGRARSHTELSVVLGAAGFRRSSVAGVVHRMVARSDVIRVAKGLYRASRLLPGEVAQAHKELGS